jgi:pyruvate formate lyase activating enzyme
MKEAWYYEKLDDRQVKCTLCPHNCKLTDGKFGICGVRQNQGGILYTHVYENAITIHIDPIEKKPLFHVYPGSKSFSLATVGCNLSCKFCQNHDISQMPRTERGAVQGQKVTVNQVVTAAMKGKCKTIACTYTEPTIFYEYAFDIAKLAEERGVKSVFVTNGYINEEPLRQIAPYLIAANVDLKGWDESFYRKVVGGDLQSVLKTLKLMKTLGIWLEVTTLVVPEYVDSEDKFHEIALFIKNELGPETPWHISRFYPNYECNYLPPTPVEVLRRAREIGLEEGLRYVYSGNVPGDVGESTFCYACGKKLIERYGFAILSNIIKAGKCPGCGTVIEGVGMSAS